MRFIGKGGSSAAFKVATIHGVAIKLHVSLLFLLFYIMLVASVQFPYMAQRAGYNVSDLSGSPLAWSALFAVALFFSILLHEFGHVLVAQAMGIRVPGITLMMFGGISEMEHMPDSRYGELRVAIAGPVVSFALAGALLLLASKTSSPNVAVFGEWLGRVNLVLGIFNLLPAFPMDGGRVLRSILAVRKGTLHATEITVSIARGFAWFFGLFGLLQFNLLLVIIAFFLYSAAQSELFFVSTRRLLGGVKAGHLGIRVMPIDGSADLTQAVNRMIQSHDWILPVSSTVSGVRTDDRVGLIGIAQIRDVPRGRWASTPVSQVMEVPTKILEVNDAIGDALESLASSSVRALPLAENDRIIGILRYSDVVDAIQFKSLQAKAEEEEEEERPGKKAA